LVFDSAVVLDLNLPEGEGRKTALGEAPKYCCRPASALCPDLARGKKTNYHFNGRQRMARFSAFSSLQCRNGRRNDLSPVSKLFHEQFPL